MYTIALRRRREAGLGDTHEGKSLRKVGNEFDSPTYVAQRLNGLDSQTTSLLTEKCNVSCHLHSPLQVKRYRSQGVAKHEYRTPSAVIMKRSDRYVYPVVKGFPQAALEPGVYFAQRRCHGDIRRSIVESFDPIWLVCPLFHPGF